MKHRNWLAVVAFAFVLSPGAVFAQRGGQGAAAPPPRAAAPFDITGYWVSVVSEDWRWRMVTPPKGDFQSLPLNPEGRRVGAAWDPARDEAAGEQCKAYGAAGIMRIPARLNISWESDNTLRMDIDAGTQTRRFVFGSPPQAAEPSWQGQSIAQWEYAGGRGFASGRPGNLKVVTTRMRPGYLRKNGVPYSANATMTEYIHRTTEANGESMLVVLTVVNDPQYLTQPLVTSTQFKKLPDNRGWNPTPCTAE